jgi:hypothetical protein
VLVGAYTLISTFFLPGKKTERRRTMEQSEEKTNEKIKKIVAEAEQYKSQLNNQIIFFSGLKKLIEMPEWKYAEAMISDFRNMLFNELTQEVMRDEKGNKKFVEPGELIIRQRVYNRINIFLNSFAGVETKLADVKSQLESLETDPEEYVKKKHKYN